MILAATVRPGLPGTEEVVTIGRVAVVLVSALVLAGCTRSTEQGAVSSPIPSAPLPSPTPVVKQSDIRFLVHDAQVGDRVNVRIENVGDITYRYQSIYQACFLSYFDSRGREFVIPPGTHCDILSEATIRPGETKQLFKWDLDECVKNNWGCVKSRPLDPGSYTIRGRFRPARRGPAARAEVTFSIAPAS